MTKKTGIIGALLFALLFVANTAYLVIERANVVSAFSQDLLSDGMKNPIIRSAVLALFGLISALGFLVFYRREVNKERDRSAIALYGRDVVSIGQVRYRIKDKDIKRCYNKLRFSAAYYFAAPTLLILVLIVLYLEGKIQDRRMMVLALPAILSLVKCVQKGMAVLERYGEMVDNLRMFSDAEYGQMERELVGKKDELARGVALTDNYIVILDRESLILDAAKTGRILTFFARYKDITWIFRKETGSEACIAIKGKHFKLVDFLCVPIKHKDMLDKYYDFLLEACPNALHGYSEENRAKANGENAYGIAGY